MIIVFQMCFGFTINFEQQKSDDKSKFGGRLRVAHIQNCHQTQGLLEMDIQSLNLKGLKMHTAYTVYLAN